MKVIEREKEERERRIVRERKRGRERVNESGSELSRISQVCKTNDMVGQNLTQANFFPSNVIFQEKQNKLFAESKQRQTHTKRLEKDEP